MRGIGFCRSAESKRFTTIPVDILEAIFALIFALNIVRASTLLFINIDKSLYYVVVQKLGYRCWNVHLTTVAKMGASPTRHVLHAQQFFKMTTQAPVI